MYTAVGLLGILYDISPLARPPPAPTEFTTADKYQQNVLDFFGLIESPAER